MKLIRIKKFFPLLLVLLSTSNVFGQFPPAQGPPPVSGKDTIRELPVFMFKNIIEINLRDSVVPKINASIVQQDPAIGINVSFTLSQGKPHMSETKFTDRPNEKIVTIPFKVDFKLDLSGVPDRHINQDIRVDVSCNNWFTGSGEVTMTLHAEKPFLEGPSFGEQAINFFVGNWLTPFIDSQINSNLPGALRKSLPLELFKPECNCLDVVVSGPAPLFKQSFIKYQKKKTVKTQSILKVNSIQVSVDSIKRLSAKNLETGSILYDSLENVTVEFYANHEARTFNVEQIIEGQSRKFSANKIEVTKPGSNGTLVLIANVTHNDDGKRDSRFVVFNSAQNFGNGIHKMIVQKSFLSKPSKLPDGSFSNPMKIFKDAYELTVSVVVKSLVLVK